MKRLFRISAAILALVVVCAALGVGVWWLMSALPAPETAPVGVSAAPAAVPTVAPREMGIPWKRDPEVILLKGFAPIPLPGVKQKGQPRPVPSWWSPPVGVVYGRLADEKLDGITALVKSEDPAKVAQGIAGIEDLVKENPVLVARMLAGTQQPWSRGLLAAKRFKEVDRLATEVMIPVAFNVDLLDGLWGVRVAAAEGMGEPVEGKLREWFAISSLRGTGQVLVQMRRLLRVKALPEKFVVDPEEGEAKGFGTVAGGMDGEDYGALLQRANLWLMAGKSELAEPVFRRAYMMAAGGQVEAAGENFARVVKARTGSAGETNEWLKEHSK
ncbi:MAG: hypothetical protein ACTHN5_07550 [Phycisphaerae bacterium]